MKRKWMALLLTASMVMTLAACGTSSGAPAEINSVPLNEDVQKPAVLQLSGSEAAEAGTVTTSGNYVINLSDLEHQTDRDDVPIVYFTNEITPESLMAVYEALGRTPAGNVAVKLHTGEGENSYNLKPDFIKDLVQAVDGTIVECNTAYGGNRASTAFHMQVAEDRGYTAIADVDIMDAEGGFEIPVIGGTRLETNQVGSHFTDYDFFLVLSHFKGHAQGGFGGALKNMSIGIASSEGKSLIHSGGTETTGFGWATPAEVFTESMAEAAKSVYDYLDGGENLLYINVMNNVSVDCDCNANPAKPDMHDVGIFASLDPVALDQACVDFLYAVPDGESVIRRMQSRMGEHILEHAEEISFGSRAYHLVSIDESSVLSNSFTDVADDAWYADAVDWCVENDIMSGMTATAFSPNTDMIRVTVAEALYRAEGRPAAAYGGEFSDVASNSEYAGAVAWSAANGIMSGYGGGVFGTNDPVTREQLAAILWRYASSPAAEAGEDFADEASIADYARTAVDWARSSGIVEGKPGNLFDPKAPITRAEVTVILYRYLAGEHFTDYDSMNRAGEH